MPYRDEDLRRPEIDGYPADYYPPRRSRMIIGAVLAGWAFMMISSSHPVFFDRVYRGALQRIAWLMPPDKRLGDWPSTGDLYALQGVATV